MEVILRPNDMEQPASQVEFNYQQENSHSVRKHKHYLFHSKNQHKTFLYWISYHFIVQSHTLI